MASAETPLAGRRMVITRAEGQGGEFAAKLRALGAEVIEFPTISIRPAADFAPLDAAIARLGEYDWLIFTSANGVRFFAERLNAPPRELRVKVCAIGPATRRAVEELGLKVDIVPREYVAESLVEAFAGEDLSGKRVLLPRAAVARDVAPEALRARGALVDVVEAYRTVIPEDAAERAREIFGVRKPDWITFTSSSTVKNFLEAAGREALTGVRVASIGRVTSHTLREHGVAVDVEARVYTTDGLIEAIIAATEIRDGA
ncbi:MAG: uroporphyrinogen-III synthase [Bryobacterales bacterium]|nr:uroporphyrinogen-III synthase [Bryobacterales bacterium]